MRSIAIILLCTAGGLGCSSDGSASRDGQAARERGAQGDGAPVSDGARGEQPAGGGPYGSCRVDAGGQQTCVEYVGSSFAPPAALDAAHASCTQSSGSWSGSACARDGMQGYCTWLEGQPTEERHYYFNHPTDALNQAKVACESVDGHRWHRT